MYGIMKKWVFLLIARPERHGFEKFYWKLWAKRRALEENFQFGNAFEVSFEFLRAQV